MHTRTHRADIRVETHANVLNIEDERVDLLKHLGSRTTRLPVQAVHFEPCFGIRRVVDIRLIQRSVKTMFGTEERRQINAPVKKRLRKPRSIAERTRLIRQKSDAFTLQKRVRIARKNVRARERLTFRDPFPRILRTIYRSLFKGFRLFRIHFVAN